MRSVFLASLFIGPGGDSSFQFRAVALDFCDVVDAAAAAALADHPALSDIIDFQEKADLALKRVPWRYVESLQQESCANAAVGCLERAADTLTNSHRVLTDPRLDFARAKQMSENLAFHFRTQVNDAKLYSTVIRRSLKERQ